MGGAPGSLSIRDQAPDRMALDLYHNAESPGLPSRGWIMSSTIYVTRKHALWNLCLVSKSWIPCTRKHLPANIVLHTTKSAMLEVISGSLHLSRTLRHGPVHRLLPCRHNCGDGSKRIGRGFLSRRALVAHAHGQPWVTHPRVYGPPHPILWIVTLPQCAVRTV